jgi:hypothetical protein
VNDVNNNHTHFDGNFYHEGREVLPECSMDITQEIIDCNKKEEVCKIKRSKNKAKVVINPKTVPLEEPRPSSASFSEDAESNTASCQVNKSRSCLHGNSYYEGHDFLRSFSMDVQSEFAYLKQQNRFLEEKLDILLKITLNLDGSDGFRSGEKRRRLHAPYAHNRHMEHTHPEHHHYDECKYSEDARFLSHHYGEGKLSEDPPCHYNGYEPCLT